MATTTLPYMTIRVQQDTLPDGVLQCSACGEPIAPMNVPRLVMYTLRQGFVTYSVVHDTQDCIKVVAG